MMFLFPTHESSLSLLILPSQVELVRDASPLELKAGEMRTLRYCREGWCLYFVPRLGLYENMYRYILTYYEFVHIFKFIFMNIASECM